MTPFRLILCLLLVASSLASAQARTVWVDDKLYLPVRSGAGTQYRIIENALPSGTPLEVLEVGENYTRVRTPKGTEGWVASQYLSNTPIAEDRLKAANRELEQARAELSRLKEQLSQVTEERNALKSSESSLADRSESLQEELQRIKSIAADAIDAAVIASDTGSASNKECTTPRASTTRCSWNRLMLAILPCSS